MNVKRLAVQTAFFLALASAAASLFVSVWVGGAACVVFIAAGLLLARRLEKNDARKALLLAAMVAVLSLVLLSSRFLASAGFASIAAVSGGLVILYFLFKHVALKQPIEAKVVSAEGGKAVVEVGASVLQSLRPGLYELEARGLKKGSKVKVEARHPLFGKSRLKRVK
ncbi:MAG: hypothetical protein AB1626_01430 [Candidatus Micrarchaeota archaeon]